MKKFLTLLSVLLCMALLLSALPAALAAPTNPFKDVAETAYYYDAVLWALDNNITTGTSSTAFSPDKACTRGQIVTFLWRAQGCPAPSATAMPFEDVPDNAYYYDAVLWAVENNITTGVSKTAFGPERPCTRGQIVTFLWRSAGCPEPAATSNPFGDVQESAYYYKAVLWALEQNITTGVSKTAFGPDRPCTRGQIVTFLYRYLGSKLTITSQPKDYQMQSSMEEAIFTVTVSGGTAPYTYRWYILYDNEEVSPQPVISEEKSNTLAHTFSDYDFEDYRSIVAYCEITDANNQKVTSKTAEVFQYVSFAIASQPKDYQMQSSMEDASFTVSVKGGAAPYTYRWYVLYDNDTVTVDPVESNETSNTLVRSFSDYDFEAYRGILVYCEITDANNEVLVSQNAEVLPKG